MMTPAVEKALSLVGQGYIYGAKGQICTPDFRAQQAQQYPQQADHILNTGAKWDGVPVWDCAQLTRACAKAAGIDLVSGATSQWNKTAWAQKGEISTLPTKPVFVFRMKNGRMQHTGLALGDGTCVHARGTAYGVVRQPMADCAWTHWAGMEAEPLFTATVFAPSGSTVNARIAPGGSVERRIPLGTQVQVLRETDGWSLIRLDGFTAWMQSAYLRRDDLLTRIENIEARLNAAGL